MHISINCKCRVKLLKRGVQQYYKHFRDLDKPTPKAMFVGSVYEGQLWEIMMIFGPVLYMGPEPPFETDIELDVEPTSLQRVVNAVMSERERLIQLYDERPAGSIEHRACETILDALDTYER